MKESNKLYMRHGKLIKDGYNHLNGYEIT